ncbi:hypothetical protein KR093_010236 [Drosophila rubida]|uniref:Uncharacterized protein n=1 Tax=Drosophila rubida TaxID=30044 RepID=A0AAD4KA69_9MUSC|nr:hypothetical protein KR093_010236 [Drosophila rubida]
MSMSSLSVDRELRYIIQWFNEWSELQRDDFVYVFVEYLTRDTTVGEAGNGIGNGSYVNGVVHSLATSGVQEKPMSLFQCRIKLFREWNPKWPSDFKCKLQEKINEIDPKVGEKIINELKTPHSLHNGDVSVHLNVNGTSGNSDCELEQSTSDTIEAAASDITTSAVVVAAVVNDVIDQTLETDNDNHLAAVLRQETPVDDDDDRGHAATNGTYASSSSAVTTIAVNASPTQQQQQPPSPSQPIVEPVEQVENNVSASVIVSVAPPTATAAEIVPVA